MARLFSCASLPQRSLSQCLSGTARLYHTQGRTTHVQETFPVGRQHRPGVQRGRAGPDQMGPAQRLPGQQLPRRKPDLLHQGRRHAVARQAEDHAAQQRLAVQGARDQARGAGQPGPDRRNPADQLRQRRSGLRTRRPALPGHRLRRFVQAVPGAEAVPGEEAERARHDAAVRRGLAAPGHFRQPRHQAGVRHEGPEVARLQPRDGQDRRTGRRPAGDGAAGRTGAGHGHRRDRFLHVLGLHRLRHQDLRVHQEVLRHPGLAAQERHHRQQEGVRRARSGHPGRAEESRRAGRGTRLEAVAGKEQVVPAGTGQERHGDHPAHRRTEVGPVGNRQAHAG